VSIRTEAVLKFLQELKRARCEDLVETIVHWAKYLDAVHV
jgi:hypothetical protein